MWGGAKNYFLRFCEPFVADSRSRSDALPSKTYFISWEWEDTSVCARVFSWFVVSRQVHISPDACSNKNCTEM